MTAATAHPPTALRPIPTKPEDLDTEWLRTVLRQNGFDGALSGFRAERFGEGAGMMSLLTRVELDYAGGSGPASVVVKMPAASDANRATAVAFHCYSARGSSCATSRRGPRRGSPASTTPTSRARRTSS